MKTTANNGVWIFQDSLAAESAPLDEAVIQAGLDSIPVSLSSTQNENQSISNTLQTTAAQPTQIQGTSTSSRRNQAPERTQSQRIQQEENQIQQPPDSNLNTRFEKDYEVFNFYQNSKNNISYKPHTAWTGMHSEIRKERIDFKPKINSRSQLNWTLVIGLFSLLILLYLKTFFQKFVIKVVNTVVNFQLADTMLREKNAVVRRAFFLMNLNFILILSLFILLFARFFEVRIYDQAFFDYLFFLGIVIALLLIRLVLYYIIGFIFEWRVAVNSQLHTNYLINKNLGLFLLPLVFIAIYANPVYSGLILYSGAGILILATIYRLIRGFQIIIKNGILLFYAILYLCTLELLPIVIGSKIIISLR